MNDYSTIHHVSGRCVLGGMHWLHTVVPPGVITAVFRYHIMRMSTITTLYLCVYANAFHVHSSIPTFMSHARVSCLTYDLCGRINPCVHATKYTHQHLLYSTMFPQRIAKDVSTSVRCSDVPYVHFKKRAEFDIYRPHHTLHALNENQ